MEKLTSSCKPGRNVVSLASQVEQMYHSLPIKTTRSLTTLLRVWQKTTAVLADGKQEAATLSGTTGLPIYTARDAAEHATRILMEADSTVTDTACYNAVIGTNSHSHIFLNLYMKLRRTHTLIDVCTHTRYLVLYSPADAWAKSNYKEGPQTAERLLKKLIHHETLSPDVFSYNGILDAWSQSQDPDAMKRLKQIYKHMLSGNMVLTIRTLNHVLSAYAKQISKLQDKNEMVQIAADAYELMQEEKERYAISKNPDQQPDVWTYSTMIDIYGKCGVVKTTMQAEALLTELKDLYATQNLEKLQPNVRTYTSLISAWSKTKSDKAAIRGEELLQEMYLQPETKPNYRTYAALCTCWARSQDPDKATRVLGLVRSMKQRFEQDGDKDCKPNLMVYNSAIDACSRSGGDAKQQTVALKVAFAMNKAMLVDGLVPDSMTFDRLMQATAFLMSPGDGRNGVAIVLLDKAKAAGCVSFDVVKNFRKAVDNNVVHVQLKDMEDKSGQIDYTNIPKLWAKNCK